MQGRRKLIFFGQAMVKFQWTMDAEIKLQHSSQNLRSDLQPIKQYFLMHTT